MFKGCELIDSASQLNSEEFLPQVEKTDTYYPLSHADFYSNALEVLSSLSISITSSYIAVNPHRNRLFMWLDTDAIVKGMPLCIGGRNSYDKSMSAGLCVGTKIMVCSNKVLASYENGGVVSRKHTSAENIDELSREFHELLQSDKKHSFMATLDTLKNITMRGVRAKEYLVDLTLSNTIKPTDIAPIWQEFTEPRHEEFKPFAYTQYNFLMACTEVFKTHKSTDYQNRAYEGVAKLLGL